MAVLIGHASISEKNTINGTKGDSTGKEVCIRSWYSNPWEFMAIHPDKNVREKHALAIETACKNDNIGYGQSDRNTLNALAKVVGYDLSKVGKCNCDCSSLQNVAAVASGAKNVTYGSNGWTTSSMKSALLSAGYKIITDNKYLTGSDYCVRGAIYVKSGAHTVCGLTNGSKAEKTLEKASVSNTSSTNKLYKVQVGSFSIKSNADNYLRKIKTIGYTDAFVTKIGSLYKVQVGAFTIKANAETLLKQIKQHGYTDAFITSTSV